MAQDIYQNITDRIIELLDQGVIPWRKSWAMQEGARNLVSDKAYRGMNAVLLSAAPYESPFWLTYNQAKANGGHVRKGERGWPIVYWELLNKTDDDGEVTGKIPLLKSWTVFNVTQCEGINAPPLSMPPVFNRIEAAEQIIAGMPNAPTIHHNGGDRAYYRPHTDTVHLPTRESFETPEHYYNVAYHELAHATGHTNRLSRPDVMQPTFGSDPYAREELVAEMTAAMLSGVTGIAPKIVESSAAYIASWLNVLKSDKKLLIQSAAAAQKAADFIRGQSPPPDTAE